MSRPNRNKHRVSLSTEQIRHIIELARCEQPEMSDISISLIHTLSLKLDSVGQESYQTLDQITPNGGDKEIYWERCFEKWAENEDSCTTEEIAAAHEWRYLCGLMSTEEVEEFELQISLKVSKWTNENGSNS